MKKVVILTVLILALGAPGSALSAPTAVKATQFNDWSPFKVVIKKFGKVKWTNSTTDTHHEIKSYAYKGTKGVGNNWLPLQMLHPGDFVTKRFKKTGRYFYRCPIHSTLVDGECGGMCGLVRVRS